MEINPGYNYDASMDEKRLHFQDSADDGFIAPDRQTGCVPDEDIGKGTDPNPKHKHSLTF